MPQVKVLAGLTIVAIAVVLASADSLQVASQLQPDPFRVESAQQRFAGAAARLPPRDEVAYITDVPVDGKGTPAFLAAQYALAPRLVTPAGRSALVPPQQAIGNFSRPTDYAAEGARAGYYVVADLGNGVVLYAKAK